MTRSKQENLKAKSLAELNLAINMISSGMFQDDYSEMAIAYTFLRTNRPEAICMFSNFLIAEHKDFKFGDSFKTLYPHLDSQSLNKLRIASFTAFKDLMAV